MEKGGGIIAVKTASSTLHDINVSFLLRPNYNDSLEYSKTIIIFYPSNDFTVTFPNVHSIVVYSYIEM